MPSPTVAAAPAEAAVTAEGWRRDFRWRWTAYTSSELGTALGYSALPIVAILLLDATDFQVSLLTVFSGVVSALVALPLGPWIEYHRKLPVMVGADLLCLVAVGSIPVAAYLGRLTYGHLCVVAVVRMAATLAFNSASLANLKSLVPAAHRTAATSRLEATLWTVNTVGVLIGGALMSWLGATATMLIDAASFLGSALALRRLRTTEPPPPTRAPDHHWAKDLLTGWRVIFGHRGLTALFLNSLIFGGCVMAAIPLMTVLILRDLGFAPWQFGLVFGVSSVGGVAGSLLVKPVTRRLGKHPTLLAAGVGRNLWLGLIPLAAPTGGGLALLTVSELLLVFFAGLFNPTFAAYRWDATDDRYQSRVTMAWSVTTRTVQPMFIAAAGLLAAATDARTALLALAALLLTATALLPWRHPI